MIKYIRATIIFTMIISIVTLFAGCDQLTNSFGGIDLSILDNLTSKKQVPVYSGMTVSTIPITSASASANAKDKTDVDYSGNNGNHNGHFKGDYEDNNSSIDTSNPFPDNNQTIEDSIDDSLNVLESNSVKYYGVTDGDIYINIHISNPDQFEILSFTLNGVKYSNYMFEPGSNMELIILKLNVGKVSGLIEYTIDAIKYIDGSTIKDAIIAGDQTVAVGIKDDDQVTAKISELEVETNKISFNVIINDRDNLIGLSNGSVQAILYDGNSIIATKDLSLGKNFVKFENLKTGTVYQYAIVGFYDDFSGIGFDSNLLYKNAVSTDAIVLFSNITLSYNTIDFDFIWMDDYSKKKLTSLSLYKDGELLKSLSTDTTRIDDLLSANTYKLIARYENNGIEEEIYLEFTTAKFVAPNITISLVFKTQTSITFDIIENDDQDLGNIISIDLYNENGKIAEADSLDTREFIGLESDSTYTIKVTYLYNLKDGSAPITTTSSITCSLEKDFAYGIDPSNNTIMITKSRLSYAEEIIIPDTIDGYTVSGIASYAFADHSGLKKLVIPNSVTFIDYAALSGCSSLTDLSIPYVGSPLESSAILYPFGYIFGSDFYNNSVAINQIYLAESLIFPTVTYYVPASLHRVSVTNSDIPHLAFFACTTIKEAVIGENIKNVGIWSFSGCTSLESVTVHDALIDEGAFKNCINLKTVTIYNANIGTEAFYGCTNLTTLYIESGTIDHEAFRDCHKLSSITLGDGVIGIGSGAFIDCTALTELKLGKNVGFLGEAAFGGCINLSAVIMYETMTYIDFNVFVECTNLKIYYTGTEEQWNNIYIAYFNDELLSAPIYCNYIYSDDHAHSFTLKNTSQEYMQYFGGCTEDSVYYYSCECGFAGSETFSVTPQRDHTWIDANCINPKTCSYCAATEGDKLGHNLVNNMCTRCSSGTASETLIDMSNSATNLGQLIAYNTTGNLYSHTYFYSKYNSWNTPDAKYASLVTNTGSGDVFYHEYTTLSDLSDARYNEFVSHLIDTSLTLNYSENRNEYIVVDFDFAYISTISDDLGFMLVPRLEYGQGAWGKYIYFKYFAEYMTFGKVNHITVVASFTTGKAHVFVNGIYATSVLNGAVNESGHSEYLNGYNLTFQEVRFNKNTTDSIYYTNMCIRYYSTESANDNIGAAISNKDIYVWSENIFDENYRLPILPSDIY